MFDQPLLIASNNLDKTAELAACLQSFAIAAQSYQTVNPRLAFPSEGTSSYFQNARQKALFIAQKLPKHSILADDSGMLVAAYPQRFGVQTSRQLAAYPGDAAKNQYLIALVAGQDRHVTLRTDLVLWTPNHRLYHSVGVFTGTFSHEERGQNGFGFDKILIPDAQTKTLAEMTTAEKLPFLHRTKAVKNLLEKVAHDQYESI
ncbi:non-canonical purine NTP pyrophosphatase [Pediococcus siamensis]|uniref:non-canonical purine NTP pyrophosphatase n=1 Tax=Pediococcus siamensis TaxID=381829 RepID=UPI00399FCC2A